jgi:DNA-binding response OmpR family regulator
MRNGPLDLDVEQLRVRVRGRIVPLAGLQLKLLLYLARRPGWVFSREQLLKEVWGVEPSHRDLKTVDVLVCRLKRRLGVAGRLIESVRSFGYRMRTTADTANDRESPQGS